MSLLSGRRGLAIGPSPDRRMTPVRLLEAKAYSRDESREGGKGGREGRGEVSVNHFKQ